MGDMNELMEKFYAEEIYCAVKGDSNYRDEVYADYKASRKRKPQLRNKIVPQLTARLISEGFAVPAHGYEADDLCRQRATLATEEGDSWTVCTIDKDLKMIGGRYYNIKSEVLTDITEKEAWRCLYSQLLQGDPTDNIAGLPGVGPVSAKNLIWPCETEEEMQEVVVDAYMKQYGYERWKDELELTGELIYILRDERRFPVVMAEWSIVKELSEEA